MKFFWRARARVNEQRERGVVCAAARRIASAVLKGESEGERGPSGCWCRALARRGGCGLLVAAAVGAGAGSSAAVGSARSAAASGAATAVVVVAQQRDAAAVGEYAPHLLADRGRGEAWRWSLLFVAGGSVS